MMTLDKFIHENNVNLNIKLNDPRKSSRLNHGSAMLRYAKSAATLLGPLYGQEYKRVSATSLQFITN